MVKGLCRCSRCIDEMMKLHELNCNKEATPNPYDEFLKCHCEKCNCSIFSCNTICSYCRNDEHQYNRKTK